MTETPTDVRAASSGWQLQGNAPEAYETYLVPAIFAACAEALVDAAGVRQGDAVLDVACGTGVIARAAARRVGPAGAVTGVDINPDMLVTARGAAADVAPIIDWREGDAAALPFADATFDVIVCQEAVQFFADRAGALREMRRVAAPGGRVTFSVWRHLDHQPVYARFAAALGAHAGPEAATMMASPFAFGDAETLRTLAKAAGLRDVDVRIAINAERYPSVEEFVRQEAASSPLAGPLSRLADDQRDALLDALAVDLAPYLDDFGLMFHNETTIVTARS